MNKSDSIKNLSGALIKAQAEMPTVKMNKENKFLHYKYATLGAVIDAYRPILAKYELGVVQLPVNEGEKLGVSTTLIHSSGEWIEDTVLISSDEQKGLSIAQSAGVAITYLRRYSLASLLGLYADEDTDASESHEGKDVVLDKKPTPEKKVAVPATDIQKLRVAFGELFSAGTNAGLKNIPTINGKSTEAEIKAAMNKITKMLHPNGEVVAQGE